MLTASVKSETNNYVVGIHTINVMVKCITNNLFACSDANDFR